MRAAKAIRYEIWRTLSDNKIALGMGICFLLLMQLSFLAKATSVFGPVYGSGLETGTDPFSVGDIVAFVNRGMEPFDPVTHRFFTLDMIWAAPYFLLGYMACSAFSKEAKGGAYQVIPRVQSRYTWVASKYVRALLVALAYLGLELLFAVALSIVFGGTSSLLPTQRGAAITGLAYQSLDPSAITMMYGLILLAALAFVLFVTTISLICGSVATYLVIIFLVVSSAYFDTPWLFLGYSMAVRGVPVNADWASAACGIIVCVAVSLVSLATGLVVARKVELR